jgi:hypothetical protein
MKKSSLDVYEINGRFVETTEEDFYLEGTIAFYDKTQNKIRYFKSVK